MLPCYLAHICYRYRVWLGSYKRLYEIRLTCFALSRRFIGLSVRWFAHGGSRFTHSVTPFSLQLKHLIPRGMLDLSRRARYRLCFLLRLLVNSANEIPLTLRVIPQHNTLECLYKIGGILETLQPRLIA